MSKLVLDKDNSLLIIDCDCGAIHTISSNDKKEFEMSTKESEDNDGESKKDQSGSEDESAFDNFFARRKAKK